MRKLAIFTGGYAAAVFAAVLLAPTLDPLMVGAVCAGIALLLALLRRVLPGRARRRALICCAGMALGMLWTGGYDRSVLAPIRQLDDTTIVLTGTVADWPEKTEYGVQVHVHAQLPAGGSADARVYMDERYADLQPGDRVTTVAHCTFVGRNEPIEPVNYNAAKGVFLTAVAYGEAEVSHPERMPLSTLPVRAMHALWRGIEMAFTGRTQTIVRAIVTGAREQLEPLMTSGLQRTGLTHTVAVSGMHLAFLAGFLELLLGRGRRRTAFVTIPVVILFVFMIGCTPSAVRAAVMLILLQLAPLLGREGDTPTSLMLALFLLLVHNPYACADIGLQLSFGAVAGIALFAQKLQDRMTSRLEPGRGVKRLYNSVVRTVAAVISVTLGAQVFTLPLTAFYFDTISLVSPLANLLCLWAVYVLFVLGALGGVVGILLPGVAGIFGTVAAPVGEYLYRIVTWLARFPFAAISAGPELYRGWMVFLYALLALALLLPGKKRMALPCTAAAVALLFAIACTMVDLYRTPVGVDVLDVGQGQSVLLRSGSHFALVDCGADSYHQAGDIAADRLCHYGRTELDLLIISHYHDDHANGVLELLDRIDVKCIALPDVQRDSDLRQAILAQAERKNIEVVFVREDCELALGEAVLKLYPPLGKESANELGLTVLFSELEYDVLLTGDMDAECERELLDHTHLPDVELMVAGHHGSKHSNSTQLLESIRPEIAVISVGGYNRFGHPTPEAMERLSAVGAELYRTDTMGTVTLTVDPMKKGA